MNKRTWGAALFTIHHDNGDIDELTVSGRDRWALEYRSSPGESGSKPPLSKTDHCETADNYRGELFRRGRLRIVLCRDGIQWILQRKKAGAGKRWQALGYCTTRNALTRLWTASEGETAPELARFPETITRARHD